MLFRSLSLQTVRLLRLFGNYTATKVIPSVGAEQEYFLIDRKNYLQRIGMYYASRKIGHKEIGRASCRERVLRLG